MMVDQIIDRKTVFLPGPIGKTGPAGPVNPDSAPVDEAMAQWITTPSTATSKAIGKLVPNRINLLLLGADNTGTVDSSASLRMAIEQANDNQMDIYIPYGRYLITTPLPKIDSGVLIFGEAATRTRRGTILLDRRPDNSGYLFDFVFTTLGGGLRDLSFDGGGGANGAINITDHSYGWDGRFDGLTFYGYYSTAINLDCNDCSWNDVLVADCGGVDSGGVAHHAIVLSGSCNRNVFTRVHMEHCRFMVDVEDSPFMNHFIDSKFELSTKRLVSHAANPIMVNTVTGNTPVTFTNCDFVGLDIRVFSDAAGSDYNIPHMIFASDSTILQINGSRFYQGLGSAESSTTYFGQVRWLRMFYGAVSDSVFYSCSYMTPSLEVGNAILSGDMINFIGATASTDDTGKQVNRVAVRSASIPISRTVIYTGSLPDGYVPNDNNSGTVLTNSKIRNGMASVTGDYYTWYMVNLNTGTQVFANIELPVRYEGTLGMIGRVALNVVYDAGVKILNLTNISLMSMDAKYKTIAAYLLSNGDVLVQMPNTGKRISIIAHDMETLAATSYIDTSITSKPSASIVKTATLTLP